MTVAEKIVKEELKELRDNTKKIEELAKEVRKQGYEPNDVANSD